MYGAIARLKGARVIYQIHPTAFWDYYNDGGFVRRLAIRTTLQRANAIIVITAGMKASVPIIAPNVPLYLVPNPLDLDLLPAPDHRDPSTVAFVGWLVPNKGVFELVDAVAAIRKRHSGLRVVFAGSKDDGRLRAYANRRGIGDIAQFPGWLAPEAVAGLLGRATALALPSYTEGVPMAILEALASGTPIVTTPVGGIPDILTHRRNALLIPPRDVQALAAALEEILGDERLRAEMSEANRIAARAFDVHTVIATLRGIYRIVLAPPGT